MPSSSEKSSRKSSSNLEKVPNQKTEHRTKDALSRLGVSAADLKKAPHITEILKEKRGGKSIALEAMRFSEEPLIQEFFKKYDSIPVRDRANLPLEAIAIAAGINVRHLLGEILLACREHSVMRVKFIAVANHPATMQKRVEAALTLGGVRDRDALDTMLGALPSNKGSTFINKFFAAGKEPDAEGEETDQPKEELVDDMDFIFPDASIMQERVQPMRQKLLESKK